MKLISIEQRILDKYQNYATAWSLRRLRSPYSGACIRVRRSEDNAEQDIPFKNDLVDTDAIESFLSARNIFLRSEELDNAYWTKTNVTVLANNTTDPLGGSTADRMTETTANNFHFFSLGTAANYLIAGHTYIVSIYAKAGTVDWFQLGSQNGSFGLNQWANFDLVNGVVGTRGSATSAGDCSITSVGSGWYRCSLRCVATASSFNSFYFALTNNTDSAVRTPTYVGNTGSYVWVWGMQYEQGTTLSPYQATTTLPYGIGYVTTFYDQSGAGIDLAQATAINQPVIAFGTVVNCNGKPGIFFQGAQNFVANNAASYWKKYHDGSILWAYSSVVQFGVVSNPNTVYRFFDTLNAASANVGMSAAFADRTASSENNRLSFAMSRGVSGSNVITLATNNTILPNQQNIIFTNLDPANATAADRALQSVNNGADTLNALTNAVSTANPANTLWVGNLPLNSFPLVGFIQELIFWDEQKVKADIFGDFNSYWQSY